MMEGVVQRKETSGHGIPFTRSAFKGNGRQYKGIIKSKSRLKDE